jgi:hypothetical protein
MNTKTPETQTMRVGVDTGYTMVCPIAGCDRRYGVQLALVGKPRTLTVATCPACVAKESGPDPSRYLRKKKAKALDVQTVAII